MFEGQYGQRRRVTSRADRHGVLCRKGRRNLDQLLAFHSRPLRISAVMRLAQPPAIGDNPISDGDTGIGRCFHCPGQINAGDQRKFLNNVDATGNG
jgi:hypothetical protein